MDSVARKRQMFDTKTAIKGNSATAGRIAEDEGHSTGMLLEGAKGARDLMSGNWFGLADRAMRLKQLGFRNNEAMNSEIANILTAHDLPIGSDGQVLSPVAVPRRSNYFAKTGGANALMAGARSPKERSNK
jgi:hypothetical protein